MGRDVARRRLRLGEEIMRGVDQADADVDAGIEDGHDLVSGQCEDHLHAGIGQSGSD